MFVFAVKTDKREPGRSGKLNLLRRAADAIDDLSDVEVHDVVWRTKSADEGRSPSVSVYYSRLVLPDAPTGCQCHEKPAAGTSKIITEYHRYFDDPKVVRAFAKNVRNHAFYLSNPNDEPEICSVAKLLRRAAEAAAMLGKVDVEDIVLQFDVTAHGREPSITVHYSHPHLVGKKRRRQKNPDRRLERRTPVTTQPERSNIPKHHAVQRLLVQDPKGEPGYLSRPRLLRWTADALDDLGDVDVHDLVLHEELMEGKWVPEYVSSVSVYYNRREQPSRIPSGDGAKDPVTSGAAVDTMASHKYFGDHIDPQMPTDSANHMFYLYNPRGKRRFSLPILLRRTARAVEDLDKAEVDDAILHFVATAEGPVPVVAVYYSRPSPSLEKSRRQIKRYAQYLERHDRTKRKPTKEKRARTTR